MEKKVASFYNYPQFTYYEPIFAIEVLAVVLWLMVSANKLVFNHAIILT